MTNLITACIMAIGIGAIALISVQNARPTVALRFLGFESIQMPIGVLLALSVAVGVVGMAVMLLLGRSPNRRSRRPSEFEEI